MKTVLLVLVMQTVLRKPIHLNEEMKKTYDRACRLLLGFLAVKTKEALWQLSRRKRAVIRKRRVALQFFFVFFSYY